MSDKARDENSAASGAGKDPPRMYRPMKSDGTFPSTGASATTLGARTPKDIPVDADGVVWPETGGMSVRPRIIDIPAAFLPRRLKHINRNAGGNDAVVVFRYGDKNGRFNAGPVAVVLSLRPDAPGHGNVEPSCEMSYDEFQVVLHTTRESWVDGEND